jgi:uncharacterized protein YbjT (DUF2867 family)
MKVLVAGGTGFVGKTLIPGLIKDGHDITILQRPNSRSLSPKIEGLKIAQINLESPITDTNLSADAIINLVGIIREFPGRGVTFYRSHFLVTKILVDYGRTIGVRRFLQMSALGVKANSHTKYFRTKFEAEDYLKESGIAWTIFRPAIIFGPRSHFMALMSDMVKNIPLVPVVGDGKYKMQLVHVDDVCAGFRNGLHDERATGKTFEIGGPDILTYDEILNAIGKALGKSKVRKMHQPLWLIRPIAGLLGGFAWFPVTNDQITMLLESNCTNDKLYWEFLGLTPKRFEESLKV